MPRTDNDQLVIEFVPTPPDHDDAIACMSAYYTELGERFPNGFDPGNGNPTPELDALTPPNGVFLVVRNTTGTALGCGAVHRLEDGVGEIKRMWVDPSLRGTGTGRRLLNELEYWAAELGFDTVRLDTASPLTQAIAMYRSSGYHNIAPYNENPYAQHWFEKQLPSRI